MRLSVGLLYDSVELLTACSSGPTSERRFAGKERRVECAPVRDVCEFAETCNWVIQKGADYHITTSGREVLAGPTAEARLRVQLSDYIASARPPWTALLRHGIAELAQALSVDEIQCFREAGLLNPEDEHAVDWWDQEAGKTSDPDSSRLLEIGRRGERLSIQYETGRTGSRPRWIAFESNYAGYDILSIVERGDRAELRIEVKASERPWELAEFEVTAHEWDVALSEGSHQFHLWLLGTKELLILKREELGQHIPQNAGSGRWTTIRIPYNAFTRKSWQPVLGATTQASVASL